MPDTYTSQFSGEEIDSALRAAQIISGASTLAELRKKLEIRGDTIPVSAEDSTLISEALTKIPTTSGGGVNPNLLDNWYFGRPVNQRGQTEYTYTPASSYTIDRWRADGNGTITLKDGYIDVFNNNSWCSVMQYIDNPKCFAGKTLTASMLRRDENPLKLMFYVDGKSLGEVLKTDKLVSTTVTLPDNVSSLAILFGASTNKTSSLIAAKFELGDTQTLAHKKNEKWVLNEIPDFGEQLRRCQRYFVRLTNAYGYGWTYSSSVANFLVPLPTTLRANPVVKLTKNGEIQTINGSKSVTGFEAKGIHPNGLAIDLHNSANALISGTPVTWHDSSMDISADL